MNLMSDTFELLPENFDTQEEFWSFWDTRSSADYEEDMEAVVIEVIFSSHRLFGQTIQLPLFDGELGS